MAVSRPPSQVFRSRRDASADNFAGKSRCSVAFLAKWSVTGEKVAKLADIAAFVFEVVGNRIA